VDEDPYCWPGTRCLRNSLGLRDPDQLGRAEHEIVGIRLAALTASTVPGAYDTAHLLRFHRLLFQDVYDWAGQVRIGNISKGNVPFCEARQIVRRMDQLFGELAARQFLVNLDRESFVVSFAAFYGELNSIHPFREGNGRTQRALLRQLAAHAGWSVNWESLDRSANDGACRAYLRTSRTAVLVQLLAPTIEPATMGRSRRRGTVDAGPAT
jgi:cell filamentation protein